MDLPVAVGGGRPKRREAGRSDDAESNSSPIDAGALCPTNAASGRGEGEGKPYFSEN